MMLSHPSEDDFHPWDEGLRSDQEGSAFHAVDLISQNGNGEGSDEEDELDDRQFCDSCCAELTEEETWDISGLCTPCYYQAEDEL